MRSYQLSNTLFQRAKEIIPGGVNSPVRACRSVGRDPVFIRSAFGPMIKDADGNEYIDYVGSWGPMILGHSHPAVHRAIAEALDHGTSFGAPTELEVELAGMIIDAVPSVQMVRMVNSGTEATMSAIRLARGFTGRNIIIKFDGCYHGHADMLLVSAGSGVATLNIPGSPGVQDAVTRHTISLPYNNADAFIAVMKRSGADVAAVIIEPVAGNMGLVPPEPGFLDILREQTAQYGSLLIFDEVMTGFRVAYGGAQALYSITPDLSCFGKIVGGGLPVGAYGGRKDIMAHVAPQGPVYQAGTLSGNPIAMAAGIATLKEIRQPGFYEKIENTAARLAKGFRHVSEKTGADLTVNRVGSMIGVFFTGQPVNSYDDARKSDLNRFASYYQKMLEKGVYLPPSQFEALFVSAAHTENQIDETIRAAETSLKEIFD
jgi:glutamate-1-semialdehyde 2,1-aminomutase